MKATLAIPTSITELIGALEHALRQSLLDIANSLQDEVARRATNGHSIVPKEAPGPATATGQGAFHAAPKIVVTPDRETIRHHLRMIRYIGDSQFNAGKYGKQVLVTVRKQLRGSTYLHLRNGQLDKGVGAVLAPIWREVTAETEHQVRGRISAHMRGSRKRGPGDA